MFEFSQFYLDGFEDFACQVPQGASSADNQSEQAITKRIDDFLAHIALLRQDVISNAGTVTALLHCIDKVLYTEECEFIDLPDFPIELKRKVVRGLHLKNRIFGTYKKIYNNILPSIKKINEEEHRPFKIVEIAGGEGFLSNYIFSQAEASGLQVDIICTDIVEDYMLTISAQHSASGNRLRFDQLDAMNMAHIPDNEYDIMLSLHSIHHFSPTQLGLIFHCATRVCRQGIFAVDAIRTASNQLFIVSPAAAASLVQLCYAHVHDAAISARKMYPAQLLHSIASIACPHAEVSSGTLSLGLNFVKISNETCD